jgi:hypothetical protein
MKTRILVRVDYDTVYFGMLVPKCRRNLLPEFSHSYPEDGGSYVLQYIGIHLPEYMYNTVS